MNKVITINLNGRAYQLEEAGYEVLRTYLNQASAKLGQNPDKAEIMADFEQAIADKCDAHLNSHKTVIITPEIEEIIKTMGPVEGTNSENEKSSESNSDRQEPSKDAPKRLYQIREGAIISGVCNGLAAYFNVDVTLVRVIFVVLTVLTHGAWILVYIIMSIVIPYANTSEEKAAARGLPFNAQELLEQAREKYKNFDKTYWHDQKKQWQHWAKEKKREWHNYGKSYNYEWHNKWKKNPTGLISFGAAVGAVILAIIMACFTLLWIVAIISLLATGTLFGLVFVGVPLWITILFLTCAYNILLLPLRTIKSNHFQHNNNYATQYDNGWFGILDAIMWFTIIGFICWLTWTYVPQSHDIWDKISTVWPFNQIH